MQRTICLVQSTKTLMVQQNLMVVFAQLVHSRLEEILSFLSSVPGPEGDSALCFVLTMWCAKQPNFYGVYERKVNATSLPASLNSSYERRIIGVVSFSGITWPIMIAK